MKLRTICMTVLMALTILASAGAANAQAPGRGGGRGQGGPGGAGGGFGGPGGPGGVFGLLGGFGQRDAFVEYVDTIAQLNLEPTFTLTGEQKTGIKTIRDDRTKAMAKWRTDHQADLDKLRDRMGELRGGGGDGAREKMQEIRAEAEALQKTAPSAEDAIKQVKALLTAEQTKAAEEFIAKRQEEMERRRQDFGGGRPGGQGQQGQQGQRRRDL